MLGLSYKPDTYITEDAAGLFRARQLKRHGYRVIVHDYGARPMIAPSVHEFEQLADPAELKTHNDVKLAVICCPRPQYGKLSFAKNRKGFMPWELWRPR